MTDSFPVGIPTHHHRHPLHTRANTKATPTRHIHPPTLLHLQHRRLCRSDIRAIRSSSLHHISETHHHAQSRSDVVRTAILALQCRYAIRQCGIGTIHQL